MPNSVAQPTNIVSVTFDDLNAFAFLKTLYPGTLNTPNLDRLMGMGTTFENTFAQIAVCNASRTSVLSGLDPSLTGVHHNYNAWYDAVDPGQTLPALLHGNGYYTGLFGKVFHDQPPAGIAGTVADVIFRSNAFAPGTTYNSEPSVVPITQHGDYISTSAAIDFLQQNGDNPFALFLGIFKPHIAWDVPQEYYDMYPLDSIELPYALDGDLSDVPAFMRALITDDQGFILSTIGWKAALQGYFASITFADAMFGRLLDALEESGHLDDTAIVVWTDHGFHLGDKDDWHKFTLWDEAGRAPMIVALPGAADDGQRVTEVVELVDLMPTILDIMGVPAPTGLSGRSLVPFIENPALNTDGYAVTTMYGSVSIRTADYRYTLYEDGSMELYNIVTDPNQWVNLAGVPDYAQIAAALESAVKADLGSQGWVWAAPGDIAIGSAGNDHIVGGFGQILGGGTGDDHYFLLNGSELIIENSSEGIDTIITDKDFTLPDNVENFEQRNASPSITITGNALDNHISGSGHIYGLGGNDIIITSSTSTVEGGDGDDFIRGRGNFSKYYGGGGNDILQGNAGNDILDGGTGIDSMRGDSGNDTYYVDDANDIVIEALADGTDTVRSTINYILGNNFERLVLEGTANLQGTGNADANVLTGNAGSNTLDGRAGADSMIGGLGGDVYFIDNVGDTIFEKLGEGTDTVRTSINFTLGNNLERLVLLGTNDLQGNGNALANALTGNVASNILDGRAGADTMSGGLGDDTYFVDNTGDFVFERLDEGNDLVRSTISYTMINNIERLLLVGTANLQGIGNSLANVITGNSGNNDLKGGAGADTIYGGLGNDTIEGGTLSDQLFGNDGDDTIWGGDAADTLDGGTGANTLIGGLANDRYVIRSSADTVIESAGEGFDTVTTFTSYALTAGAEIENIIIQANAGAASFTGNELANVVRGNAYANLIDGGAGDDKLSGNGGNDTLIGGAGRDILDAGAGDDIIVSELDGDTIIGSTGTDRLTVSALRSKVGVFAGPVSGEVLLVHYNAGQVTISHMTGVEYIDFADATLDLVATPPPINQGPVFNMPSSVALAEGDASTGLVVSPTDPEGFPITYAIAAEGDGALFELAPDGTLHFLAAPDFETPADADGDNVYNVVLLASDGVTETRLDVAVTVTDANEAPVFTTVPSASLAEGSTDTGLIAAATDPEGQPLTYAIAAEGDGALFELAPDGTLRFLAAPDFETPADADGDNVYNVVLLASDGVTETRLDVAVTVTDLDEAPIFATAPTASLAEGSTDTGLVAAATDPEGQPLTYAIAAEGDGALFELAPDGTLRFLAAPDFENPADADGDNVYNVVLLASDGVTETRLDVAVTVTDLDEAPVFTTAPTASLAEGSTDTGLVAAATDPEGFPITYAIAAEGDGALFELAPDGTLRFLAAPDFETPADADGDNVYNLVLLASDGVTETRLDVAVTVTDANEAPVFATAPTATLAEGSTDTGLVAAATDPEGCPITYAIAAEGDGALFELAPDGTLRFLAAPDFEAPADADGDNVYNVVLLAGDGVTETRLDVAVTVTDVEPEAPPLGQAPLSAPHLDWGVLL